MVMPNWFFIHPGEKLVRIQKENRSSKLKYIPPTLHQESFTSNACYLELQFPCLVNQMSKLHIFFFFFFLSLKPMSWSSSSDAYIVLNRTTVCFSSWNSFVNSETYIDFFCHVYMAARTVGLWCIKELYIYLGICWKHVTYFFLCLTHTKNSLKKPLHLSWSRSKQS